MFGAISVNAADDLTPKEQIIKQILQKNYNYDAGISREFGHWAKLQLGRNESLYDTKYHQETTYTDHYNT